MKGVEAYLNMQWQPVIDTVAEGDDVQVRLTIPALPDFAVYGDSVTEVKSRWREALASHLEGYLNVGKIIPTPMSVGVVLTEPARNTASDASSEVLPGQALQAA